MLSDAAHQKKMFRTPHAAEAAHALERNASKAMTRLLRTPPPLVPSILACGTQLTRRWLRDGFNGYAPGMAGHLIATYYGAPQDCEWTLEGRRLADRLRPGSVTVVTEGHDGHWALAGPVEVSHVYLTHERLRNCAEVIAESRSVELLDRVGFDDAASSHILAILSDKEIQDDPGARLLAERAVDLLCLQLLRRHCSTSVRTTASMRGGLARWQVKRVTDYMMEHLERPIGLAELAALVRLSRYHFCTAFRVSTGRTPHAWLTEQRMARARKMLDHRDMTISEVALAVGYATPSAFAASFRRIVGMTPSNFRRRI
jgi:AraC family transcriptional regulator